MVIIIVLVKRKSTTAVDVKYCQVSVSTIVCSFFPLDGVFPYTTQNPIMHPRRGIRGREPLNCLPPSAILNSVHTHTLRGISSTEKSSRKVHFGIPFHSIPRAAKTEPKSFLFDYNDDDDACTSMRMNRNKRAKHIYFEVAFAVY